MFCHRTFTTDIQTIWWHKDSNFDTYASRHFSFRPLCWRVFRQIHSYLLNHLGLPNSRKTRRFQKRISSTFACTPSGTDACHSLVTRGWAFMLTSSVLVNPYQPLCSDNLSVSLRLDSPPGLSKCCTSLWLILNFSLSGRPTVLTSSLVYRFFGNPNTLVHIFLPLSCPFPADLLFCYYATLSFWIRSVRIFGM